MCCSGGVPASGENDVGGDPGKIERSERAEQMAAVDGAQAVGEDEVVDDARPERVAHAEAGGGQQREMLEAEQGVGRQDERPDLGEVGVGETEGFEHGGDVGPAVGRGSGDQRCRLCGL